VTMSASALPLAQPGRLTTSCTTAVRSGVCCAAVTAPAVHAGGDHVTPAAVGGRDETLEEALVNVAALSPACARMFSVVASDWDSSATNCTEAAVTVAPAGTPRFGNRMPTVWVVVPSSTISR